ncbi:Aardvark Armadillo repeat containing protein [Gracilaria domingensis]|nr:Aardvark Armadillo repeat containing protein [Gracilaria domingensis]
MSTEDTSPKTIQDVNEAKPERNVLEAPKAVKNKDDEGDEKRARLVKEAKKTVAELLNAIEKDRAATPGDHGYAFSQNPLKVFSSADVVTVDKFVASGGIRSISMAMKKHSACSAVVSSASRTLVTLMFYDPSVTESAIKAGFIESLIIVLFAQADAGSEDAKVSSLKALRGFTQDEERRKEIFEGKGLEAIIATMNKSTDNPRVLSHAALLLSNLAFGNSQIKDATGAMGGITAICNGMLTHLNHQGMQARGSLALRNLSYNSELNHKISGENGAAEALIKTIEAYPNDREVVHQSCVALVNLSNINEENRRRITRAKGAPLLVKMMQMHPESMTVNDDCVSIIRNISVGNIEGQFEVGNCGGVALVCQVMRKFEKRGQLAGKACAAIRYLSFLAENRDRVCAEGGIEAIVNILKSHIADPKLVEHALLAIGNATFEHDENKTKIGRCGGIVEIIKVLEQYRLNAGIQEHGCRVLRNLADNCEFNSALAAENGAIYGGTLALMGFPENASVQEQACAMLLNITFNASNLEKVAQGDVTRLAEKALAMHPKHRGVQLQAGSLLDRLEDYQEGNFGSDSRRTSEHNTGRSGFLGFGRLRSRHK